ncbi:MAG: DUF4404 family protein [Gammaproteobacteria bacterium]|nr:DUF4404 family protein [Gammaproteobacteria bacterium]
MSEPTLAELLGRVHAHLARGAAVEPESRQLLGTVLQDIERTLGGQGTGAATAPRLESLAVRFEASHPALAETLREVIDALGKAGI